MFGEMFGDIFGGGRRGGGRQVFRGADLKYELELDLNQAVFGHAAETQALKVVLSALPVAAKPRPKAEIVAV